MAVYVDDMYLYPLGSFGRMKMSHMISDTTEELMAMAKKIGLNERWLQQAGTYREHFDVSMEFRAKAVALGAQEITMRSLALMIKYRRDTWKNLSFNSSNTHTCLPISSQ